MVSITQIKIGTRGSPLALKQANMVKDTLSASYPDIEIKLVPIKSNADWKPEDGEKPLNADAGGKGLFAKEVEQAIMDGTVDCGVHSMKDIESHMPDELVINHVLPRAHAADVFISKNYASVDELPAGAIIGTCSPRRKSLLLHRKADASVVPFRGNVETRLNKIRNEQVDGTFLALAGLQRLGIMDQYPDLHFDILETEQFIPACTQGIIGIQSAQQNTELHKILETLHCSQTGFICEAERSVLKTMSGSCHSPLAAYATIKDDVMHLRAFAGSEDGKHCFYAEHATPCASHEDAKKLGESVAVDLRAQLPEGFSL